MDRRTIIRDVLLRFRTSSVFVDPAIPPKKLANARTRCGVPADDVVLGLIDCTLFGSAKHAVVFGEQAVYICDDWTRSLAVFAPYQEVAKLEARMSDQDKVTRPTREVLAAIREAIERAHAESVRAAEDEAAFVPNLGFGDDLTISPEATALQAAISAAPGDEATQLVLADLLLAADDPRGELIVLHQRELAGQLADPEALERYLLLAAEYSFPRATPDEPTLPFVGFASFPVRFAVRHNLHDYEVTYGNSTLELVIDGNERITRRLSLEGRDTWTPTETRVILRLTSDAIRAAAPLKSLQFPWTDAPLPSYGGGPLRGYRLPKDFTKPRGLAANRYGLAARDYTRWMDVWRKLARLQKAEREAAEDQGEQMNPARGPSPSNNGAV